jgi:hypothetical protein
MESEKKSEKKKIRKIKKNFELKINQKYGIIIINDFQLSCML